MEPAAILIVINRFFDSLLNGDIITGVSPCMGAKLKSGNVTLRKFEGCDVQLENPLVVTMAGREADSSFF